NLLHEGSKYAVQATSRLVENLRSHLVPDELLPNYQRFITTTYGPMARELGFASKPSETEDTRLLRPVLVWLVAVQGEDRRLQEQARELAVRWLEDPRAIDPEMVDVALEASAH